MVQIGSRFFFTLQCPKKISAIAMSKKLFFVVNFILLFFGNWNCVWLVYSTVDCTFSYPTCLFVGLVLRLKVFFFNTYVVYFPILDTIPAGR